MTGFVTANQIPESRPGGLAVYCTDYRIQAGVAEFLQSPAGFQTAWDAVVVPGGPQCLVELEMLPKFAWAARKWSGFMLTAHELERVMLIAHQDCRWYAWLATQGQPAKSVRAWQEDDLRKGRDWLLGKRPGINVDLYYAGWGDDGHLALDPVPA